MTRSEHLAWCKQRALECCDSGDAEEAFSSMASDLRKQPETAHHNATIMLGMHLMMIGDLDTPEKMRKFEPFVWIRSVIASPDRSPALVK